MTPDEIRDARLEFGLTTARMADLVGVQSRRQHDRGNTVRKWESGRHSIPPDVETIVRLCQRSMANLNYALKLADERRAAKMEGDGDG